ncbi:MAG: type 1 glutamine amidotransferase domain-containing protein [Alphaproteobacteria bacterium]|nr:type 1 glutamine amidotransferase domain-containing protein [Alphaproteobacteria bacterium]
MESHRILLVVTSSDRMGNAPESTGFWLEEFAAPYYVFADARCDITVASPKGGKAPIDPRSFDESSHTPSTRRYEADSKAQAAIANTLKLSSITLTDYDAVFFAGGHGTMDDFATDDAVKATVEGFFTAGKPVASVCHGPAALVKAIKKNGEPVIKGKQFTCFTDEEETAVGLHTLVPFLLESRLKEQGGKASTATAFASHVVVDGNLITGQNPASSIGVAESIIHQLRMRNAA